MKIKVPFLRVPYFVTIILLLLSLGDCCPSGRFATLLMLVVFLSSFYLVARAIYIKKYFWAWVLAGIGMLFNPIIRVDYWIGFPWAILALSLIFIYVVAVIFLSEEHGVEKTICKFVKTNIKRIVFYFVIVGIISIFTVLYFAKINAFKEKTLKYERVKLAMARKTEAILTEQRSQKWWQGRKGETLEALRMTTIKYDKGENRLYIEVENVLPKLVHYRLSGGYELSKFHNINKIYYARFWKTENYTKVAYSAKDVSVSPGEKILISIEMNNDTAIALFLSATPGPNDHYSYKANRLLIRMDYEKNRILTSKKKIRTIAPSDSFIPRFKVYDKDGNLYESGPLKNIESDLGRAETFRREISGEEIDKKINLGSQPSSHSRILTNESTANLLDGATYVYGYDGVLLKKGVMVEGERKGEWETFVDP